MRAMLAIGQAVLADAIRRRVIWVVLVFAALLAFAVPSLPSYGQGVVDAVFREVVLALMFVAALVVALVLSSTRVPSEVERRTVFTVLSRDVHRWQYLVGTWAGISAVTGIVVVAFSVVALGTGWVQYAKPMFILLEGALAIWLEASVVAAFAMLVSTRASAVTSIIASLTFLFVGHSVASLVGSAPWWLPSLEAFNVFNPVAHGSGYSLQYAFTMVAVFVVWSALLILGATALFEGRDL